LAEVYVVLSQFTRLTYGQTDGRTAQHSTQIGKNHGICSSGHGGDPLNRPLSLIGSDPGYNPRWGIDLSHKLNMGRRRVFLRPITFNHC